jgi:hypothetical protein
VPDHDSVDLDGAARYLALDVTTIRRFVRTRQLRVTDLRWIPYRVSIAELEAFVERCRIAPGTLNDSGTPAWTRNREAHRRA